MVISRRRLLFGAAAATVGAAGGGLLLVREGVLPGRQRLASALGACDVPVPEARTPPGPTVTGAFDSLRRGRRVGTVVVYPPGRSPGERLPVCLVLHGFGSDATGAIGAGAYDRYLATQVAAGTPPFALAAMDGGTGYWHPHASDDPLGALLDEFLPRLGAQGLVTDRFGVLGWSMGGYGALLCALTAPTRIAAAAATSPALWRSYAEARAVNAGAFDSADEWQRHDVLSRAGALRCPLRVDCGADDPFAPAVEALRDRVPDPSAVVLGDGCHDPAFWRSAAPHQLDLIGRALTPA